MTAQFCENLQYKNEQLSMLSNPLGYCNSFNDRAGDLVSNCTALWRGYIGQWEIIGERLYLIGIKGKLKNGGEATLEYFFPGFPDRVFAHWYTEKLRIPKGKCIKYVHMGYASKYEQELYISVEQGVITGFETISHTETE
jgi:hypothetical protein